ncbi:MAG TPA: putative glycoside hydrolase [Pseudoneobacillus sp.]|nr:putative glycoside hydrolase [Pseudoneobacillus sp.]
MRKITLLLTVLIVCSPLLSARQIIARDSSSEEPIRGIYVSATKTNDPSFPQLISLVEQTDLNAMVIDIKDDNGHLTFKPPIQSPYYHSGYPYIKDPLKLIRTLETKKIYPIARIVVFKDNVLSKTNPNLSFQTNNGIWKNDRGDSFTNPFLKEVWDYNIGIAVLAAKMGFKEIQFDYVRFPEKFETFEKNLTYQKGKFKQHHDGRERVVAVTEFVKYASEKLKPYDVKMSVDTFGNATVIKEARGIGQNFSSIAQHVDVISAMIYPSHWNTIFGIPKPDLQPYQLVKEYAQVETSRLKKLSNPPISRPWIQDFTATWLGEGNYKVYGKREIEDQIMALHSEGIDEFLLWNSRNIYTPNVDYTPY